MKEMMECVSWAVATNLGGLVGLAVQRRMKRSSTSRKVTSGGVRVFVRRTRSSPSEGHSCGGISISRIASVIMSHIHWQDMA